MIRISAAIPRINPTLAMLLPKTLPSTKSVLPFHAAVAQATISGIEVPKATTVRPITNGDTWSAAATREAPRTSHSAP